MSIDVRITHMDQNQPYATEDPKVRCGRIAEEHGKSPHVASWLVATIVAIMQYVGLTAGPDILPRQCADTRNAGPGCRTGVSCPGGYTRYRRRCGSRSGLPSGEGWCAAMPSSGSTGKPSPPSVRSGRMPPRAIRAGTRDRNHLIPLRGRAIILHQQEKTQRICFVTPTKLPYPWNLMS